MDASVGPTEEGPQEEERGEAEGSSGGRCSWGPSAQRVLGFGRELPVLCSGHSIPSIVVNNSASHMKFLI